MCGIGVIFKLLFNTQEIDKLFQTKSYIAKNCFTQKGAYFLFFNWIFVTYAPK